MISTSRTDVGVIRSRHEIRLDLKQDEKVEDVGHALVTSNVLAPSSKARSP